jgi:hypothetical protein
MSWHYLQGRAEASSEAICWDGVAFAPSKSKTTLGAYCLRDSATESCLASRYGMTLRRSTGTNGEAALTWFQGDSRVRTYQPSEKGPDLPAPDLDCGPKWPGSLAKYNPALYSWKTAQCSLFGGLELYSETWPRWGMMRDGECWAHEVAVDLWNESGFGLPAPTKCMGKRGWGISNTGRARYSEELQENARRFGYKPHPSVLEWAMGWIPTWTRLVPLATARFQRWLDSHGRRYPAAFENGLTRTRR